MQVLLKKNFKCFNHGRSIDCDPITFSFYADVVDKIEIWDYLTNKIWALPTKLWRKKTIALIRWTENLWYIMALNLSSRVYEPNQSQMAFIAMNESRFVLLALRTASGSVYSVGREKVCCLNCSKTLVFLLLRCWNIPFVSIRKFSPK